METENTELLSELKILETMIKENPCRMSPTLFSSIANTLQGLFTKYIVNGASREEVAKYFNIDVRTLTRWRKEYSDFPKAGHYGHKEVSFSWREIIAWKLKHRELGKP